jgi:hypothetical protein
MPNRKYIKGKDGRVFVGAVELEVTQHESTGESDTESFGSSMSGGKKVVVVGNGQCSGSVQGKVSAEQVLNDLLTDGDEVELKLYLTQAAQGTNKKIYRHVPAAVIQNVQYSSDPNGGGGASFQFAFIIHGDGCRSFSKASNHGGSNHD